MSLSAVRDNIRALRSIIFPSTKIMGVIKADAYGHGAAEVAGVLRHEGVMRFGVALAQEGVELRERGFDEPILILGYTPEEDFRLALHYQLTLTLYQLSQAVALDRLAATLKRRAKVHLKVDTGMGRIGFQPGKASVDAIVQIAKLSNLELEGIYTHFAWADNQESDFTQRQFARFQNFSDELAKAGVKFSIRHAANSAATINFPETHLDMVRIGICLYGLYPDPHMVKNVKIQLNPAMQVRGRLVHIKEVPEGTPLSYGCTFITPRRSIIGTVPMGYADGVPRLLSNSGEVLVNGIRCPIVGKVCMDQFLVDLTDLNSVAVGDEVVLVGSQGEENITADEIAEKAGTISYEIVSRMSGRLPRRY